MEPTLDRLNCIRAAGLVRIKQVKYIIEVFQLVLRCLHVWFKKRNFVPVIKMILVKWNCTVMRSNCHE